MIQFIRKPNYTIPLRYHIIFWLSYFTFNVIRWGSYFNDFWYSFKSNLVEFSLHILLTYFVIYYLIPKFLFNKKFPLFLLYLVLSLAVLYIIRTGLNYFLITKNIWPEAEGIQKAFSFNHIVAVIIGELYVVALATAIKLMHDWVQDRNRVEKLQQVQLETELKFLKSQIQPHFFFNTLNNLYALTFEKSEKAPDVVLKLSEIMEYVLYEVKEPRIRLYNEIKNIQNYIDLEKLRYGDRVTTDINISGDIENCYVPPLLFLPYIENCFKHGTRDNRNLKITIDFDRTSKDNLQFTVKNNFNQFSNSVKKHGIGNANVKRRLDLLYKDNYNLQIDVVKSIYMVVLNIPVEEKLKNV